MHQLKLQLIGIAQLLEFALARKQRLRVQIQFVIQRALAAHDFVKLFAIHKLSPQPAYSCAIPEVSGKSVLSPGTLTTAHFASLRAGCCKPFSLPTAPLHNKAPASSSIFRLPSFALQ